MRKIVVFDLDDTLYREVDFMRSAFRQIAEFLQDKYGLSGIFPLMTDLYRRRENVFSHLCSRYRIDETTDDLLSLYRCHSPGTLPLNEGAETLLERLHGQSNVELGIITDGRSVTQRNKIGGLNVGGFFPDGNIIVSEEFGSAKPDPANFRYFENKYPASAYYYIGDNTAKDFIAPKRLGWTTLCLRDGSGENIHPQNFDLKEDHLPRHIITSLDEAITYIMD